MSPVHGLSLEALLWFLSVTVLLHCQEYPPSGSCEPITNVTMCLHINWSNASFPNIRGHNNQIEADKELKDFSPLVNHQLQCSNAAVHFLCSVYTPFCTALSNDGREVYLPPCKELCEHVRLSCEHLFDNVTLKWPEHLACDNFPSNETGPCLNILSPESLQIPEGIIRSPSQQKTSTNFGSQHSSSSKGQYAISFGGILTKHTQITSQGKH